MLPNRIKMNEGPRKTLIENQRENTIYILQKTVIQIFRRGNYFFKFLGFFFFIFFLISLYQAI